MLTMQKKQINLRHVLAIVGIGLILTLPAISYGIFAAHDLVAYHLKWSKHFAEQFWLGDLYPRWLLEMNAGLGSPTFFFYAPVPYYFTSLFHPFFANDTSGWYQLSFSTLLALIASGITAYIWLKNITEQKFALIGSILYMALPYHLTVDLYYRFAFAEYWSFVWIPLILYFSRKIISGSKTNILGWAISYALLAMTHLPTLIIFSPVPIFYILLMPSRHQRKQALTRLVAAITLGIGLSAIYWLPAMTTQEYVSMGVLREGVFFYGNLFLFSDPGAHEKEFWRYLEVLTLLMGGLACCTFIIARQNPLIAIRRESRYWIVIAFIALFMTLPLSRPIWEVIPVVQRISFPWRFNTILTVATTVLFSLAISSLESSINFFNKRNLGIFILLIMSLLLTVIQFLPMQRQIQFPWFYNTVLIIATIALLTLAICYLKKPVNFFRQKPLVIVILLTTSLLLTSGLVIKKRLFMAPDVETALEISMDAAEYRPRWVPRELFESSSELSKRFAQAQVTSGQGSLLVQQWEPRKIVLQTNATTNIWLTLHQFYYPGWTARLTDNKNKSDLLLVEPSKPEGLLRVQVPSGKQEIWLTLDTALEERVGQVISTVSGLMTLFLGLLWR